MCGSSYYESTGIDYKNCERVYMICLSGEILCYHVGQSTYSLSPYKTNFKYTVLTYCKARHNSRATRFRRNIPSYKNSCDREVPMDVSRQVHGVFFYPVIYFALYFYSKIFVGC